MNEIITDCVQTTELRVDSFGLVKGGVPVPDSPARSRESSGRVSSTHKRDGGRNTMRLCQDTLSCFRKFAVLLQLSFPPSHSSGSSSTSPDDATFLIHTHPFIIHRFSQDTASGLFPRQNHHTKPSIHGLHLSSLEFLPTCLLLHPLRQRNLYPYLDFRSFHHCCELCLAGLATGGRSALIWADGKS